MQTAAKTKKRSERDGERGKEGEIKTEDKGRVKRTWNDKRNVLGSLNGE